MNLRGIKHPGHFSVVDWASNALTPKVSCNLQLFQDQRPARSRRRTLTHWPPLSIRRRTYGCHWGRNEPSGLGKEWTVWQVWQVAVISATCREYLPFYSSGWNPRLCGRTEREDIWRTNRMPDTFTGSSTSLAHEGTTTKEQMERSSARTTKKRGMRRPHSQVPRTRTLIPTPTHLPI